MLNYEFFFYFEKERKKVKKEKKNLDFVEDISINALDFFNSIVIKLTEVHFGNSHYIV